MYHKSTIIDTKRGVVQKDTLCIISTMKWYDYAKIIMKNKRITQEELMPCLNVTTRGAVGHYLSGRREPSVEQLINLSKKFNCSLDELLNGGLKETVVKEEKAGYAVKLAGDGVELSKEAIEFAKSFDTLCTEQKAAISSVTQAFIHSSGKQEGKVA